MASVIERVGSSLLLTCRAVFTVGAPKYVLVLALRAFVALGPV